MERGLGDILPQALKLVTGARRKAYGSPEASFGKIAAIFNLLYDKSITALDVVRVFKITKMVRNSFAQKKDNHRDAAGYEAIESFLEGKNAKHRGRRKVLQDKKVQRRKRGGGG